jgi:tryptophan 7-halogenase
MNGNGGQPLASSDASGNQQIRRIVIVGGGTAGWMAAAALARYLNRETSEILLVESDEIGTVGVGEATIPSITKFHRSLGLSEGAFIAATGATFKLGIEFVDWHRQGDRYFHPFGLFGEDVDGIGFHQIYLKLAGERRCAEMWRYAPCAAAAAAGRVGTPRTSVKLPSGGFPHAFHLDAKLYASFLRAFAERAGVRRLEGRVVEVLRSAPDGGVAAIRTADDRQIAGDLFIDCSGGRGLLIGGALDVDYTDWRPHLPCDRAIAVPTASEGEPALYTRATAKAAGWQWRIPLQHRAGNGYVYSSDHQSDAEAEAILLADIGEALAPPNRIAFRTGHRQRFWKHNVVALGLAAGFLEPLESTAIHLIQTGIAKLLTLFPDKRFEPSLAREYNRQMENAYAGVRDFIILHYKATARGDTPFWNHVREMPVPDSLAERIELFRSSGRFVRDENELFSLESWITVMLGQGIIPQGYSPLVDAIDVNRLQMAAEQVRKRVEDSVAAMPTHGDTLRGIMQSATG